MLMVSGMFARVWLCAGAEGCQHPEGGDPWCEGTSHGGQPPREHCVMAISNSINLGCSAGAIACRLMGGYLVQQVSLASCWCVGVGAAGGLRKHCRRICGSRSSG
jgi:hypothetical protein